MEMKAKVGKTGMCLDFQLGTFHLNYLYIVAIL